jgi:hypothetical protein
VKKGNNLLVLILIFLFAGSGYLLTDNVRMSLEKSPVGHLLPGSQNIIGGDRDQGGCLVGAGYSWCPSKNKCLRVWEEPCDDPEQEEIYTNQELGFSLVIPGSWKEKYQVDVFSIDPVRESRREAIAGASFSFIPRNGGGQMLFSVNRISEAGWEELQQEELFAGTLLGIGSGYVYFFSVSLDNPYAGEDSAVYQSMASEINRITDSFRIIAP